jgi:hypothetical protein
MHIKPHALVPVEPFWQLHVGSENAGGKYGGKNGGKNGGKYGGKNGGKNGGKYGGRTGVIEFEAAVVSESTPVDVVYLIVNVYAVPFVRPVTVIGVVEFVPVIEPGFDVAVYVPVPLFPLYVDSVNATVA